MTVRELMQKDVDLTVGNTDTDQEWPLVGPVRPTPHCEEIWNDVLSLSLISVDDEYATIDIPDCKTAYESDYLLARIELFFLQLAGYCSVGLWDSLFIID